MNVVHFQTKRASIESARAAARADYERLALKAAEGDTKAQKQLDEIRAELDGYDTKLTDLDAAEVAARRRAQEDAARDRAAERRAAREDAATACQEAEQAARAAQDAIAALGKAVEAFIAARQRYALAAGALDIRAPLNESLDLLLQQQMVRASQALFRLADSPPGVNRGTDLVVSVQHRNRRLLAMIERAVQDDELPPAA